MVINFKILKRVKIIFKVSIQYDCNTQQRITQQNSVKKLNSSCTCITQTWILCWFFMCCFFMCFHNTLITTNFNILKYIKKIFKIPV